MTDLTRRSDQGELMEESGISFPEFHDCLQNMETINGLTLAYRPILSWLRKAMTSAGKEPMHILDAGSGGGDLLRQVEVLARRGHRAVRLTGVDLNPWAKRSAELSSPGSSVRHETADVFSFDSGRPVDIVICSQFMHHLNDGQLVHFLRWIDRRALKGWFISDLHRHPLPYYFIKAATAIFSRNRLTRHDAAVSVARAFTRADWRLLLEKAGIGESAEVRWVFPFRLCVSRWKA